jgi:hypothetical protein
MDRKTDKSKLWFLRVVLAPLVGAGFIIGKFLDLCGISRFLSRKDDRKLENEIRACFSFLFTEKNAHFIRDDHQPKRVFDLAIATVAAEDLLFQFVRIRDDFAASVTSCHSPHSWRELNDVLEEAEVKEGLTVSEIVASRRSRFYKNPDDASRVLRDRWDQLERHYQLKPD